MANFNLNSVAMLCEFNASVWTARKLDRKKSDDVVSSAGAQNRGAARVNKNLLAGRHELVEISNLVAEARNYLYANTTPWSDAGQRLIITARLIKIDVRIEEYKAQFKEKVAAFEAIYPTLITAQAMALGDMFDRTEFPTAAEIARKFAISCDYIPLPASGDIRLDIGNQAQDELRERLEHLSQQRIDKAMADVTGRFTDHLKRMTERLAVDKHPTTGEDAPRRFTETLVSSAFELCDLVGDYNLTGDTVLAGARKDLEDALSGVTVMSLRDNPTKREDVRTAATKILNTFSFSL